MTGPTRCRGVAVVASVGLLWAGGAHAQPQPKYAPSTLLPMEPIWTTTLQASPAAGPVYEAGRIFVTLRDNQVVAVNLADGEVGLASRAARHRTARGRGRPALRCQP